MAAKKKAMKPDDALKALIEETVMELLKRHKGRSADDDPPDPTIRMDVLAAMQWVKIKEKLDDGYGKGFEETLAEMDAPTEAEREFGGPQLSGPSLSEALQKEDDDGRVEHA